MFSAPSSLRRAALPATALALVLVALVAILLVSRGTSDGGDGAGPTGAGTAATPSPTPLPRVALEDYDTSTLTVQRADFCALIAPEAVEAALGGPARSSSSYGNGQSAALTPGVTDIAHEYGCRWQRGRTSLAAWVFAPPVSPDDARRLARDARGAQGCDVRRGAPAYGSPSVARTCEREPVGGGSGEPGEQSVEASYRGLFGDAWLTCSRTAPAGGVSDEQAREALESVDDWCVAVASAASTPIS